jgi:hypothetical protein
MDFERRVIVVDDFYPDPHYVRVSALNAEYESKSSGNYPGCNSIQKFWDPSITQRLCKITGENIQPAPDSFCGQFRFIRKEDTPIQVVHFDPSPDQIWAGVIYLSLPEHYSGIQAGTTMYSHKASGTSVAPKDHIEAQRIGVNTFEDMKVFFETQGIDKSLWTPELSVNIKFNRLVLFRPWMWHAMDEHFGTDITNSRLTHLLFLSLNKE